MNYAEIKYSDVANGPGVRTTLFVSGCTHHCKGCFNEIAWDFNYGTPFTEETIQEILDSMKPDYISGLTLLGGEPFEHNNQIGLLPLVKAVKEAYPNKDIWCFSGYLFDKDILENMCEKWPETKELLSYIDVLVDGKFVEELKNLNLKFKGSENQRTILVQESLKENQVVLLFQITFQCTQQQNYSKKSYKKREDYITMQKMNIKKLLPEAVIPTYGSAYAAGADLYACMDAETTIQPGETQFIHTGIAMEIPEGLVGLVYARSGMACKKGLAPANKVGVIDSDYRGEIMVALHNHANEPVTISNGERIAQFVLTPYITADFNEVDELNDTVRGEGGFGSTGSH